MANAQLSSPPCLAERAAGAFAAAAAKHRTVLIASGVFGALAHGFAFTNKLVNHDEVYSLLSKGASLWSGRWGLEITQKLFPNFSMPWIYGILTIALIAAAVCLIADTFRIRGKLSQILLAGCVLTFPSLTGTFGYMFTSTSFALSLLCAAASVYLVTRDGLWPRLAAVAVMVFSLGIYQAYISLAAALLVLELLARLLEGEAPGAIIRRGFAYVGFLLVCLAAYYGLTQLILKLTHAAFGPYAKSSLTFSLRQMPERVAVAYTMFVRFFTERLNGLIPTPLSQVFHAVLAAVTAALVLMWALRRREAVRILLALALLGILPLAVCCMYLITSDDSIHTLVLYGFVAVYLVPLLFARALPAGSILRWVQAAAVNVLPLALAGIITVNTYVANEAYLNLYLRYENAYSLLTSVVAELRTDPQFDENTKIAIIGYYDPDFYYENFEDVYGITGVFGFVPGCYSYGAFLEYYLGVSIPTASDEEIAEIQSSEAFQSMPRYPYYGSTAWFGDIYVVKIG